MRLFSPATRFALLLFLVTASACRGCTLHHGETSSVPEPVPECEQYEATLNACHHRNLSIASDPSLLPKSDEDRARIKQFCSDNLARMRRACGQFGPLAASSAAPR